MIVIGETIPAIESPAEYRRALDRSRALYKGEDMRQVAAFAASIHPAAMDYLEQAPVLALAILAGGGTINGLSANKAYAAHKFGNLCAAGARLKTVMRAYGLPLPLRKIRAAALSLRADRSVQRLAKVAPSTLSQIIPTSTERQKRWLLAILDWRQRVRQATLTLRSEESSIPEWALVQMAMANVKGREAADMADFWSRGDESINPLWTWDRARRAADDWHKRVAAGDINARYGCAPDQRIDHTPIPDEMHVLGFDFVLLRTAGEIAAEGTKMRHCVASYIPDVRRGRCSILSVQQDGQSVATLELVEGSVRQLRGKYNAPVASKVTSAAAQFGAEVRAYRKVSADA